MTLRRSHLSLLLAILVAFALRVITLDGQGLWGDEAFTTYVIGQPWLRVLTPGLDTHPPLYYVLLKGWSLLVAPPAGEIQSVFALRFLSVVCSLPMIPLAYLAGSWLFGRGAGLLAAWLMATAPVQVYYAQEMRMYALAACLSLASTVLLIGLLQGRTSWRWPVGYALTTLLGLYTHYGVFFVLPAHGLAALALTLDRRRRGWEKGWSPLTPWLLTMAVLAVAYMPWVVGQARYLLSHAGQGGGAWGVADLVGITWRGLTSYTAGLTLPELAPLAVAAALVLGLVGIIALWRWRPRWHAVLLAAGVVSPLVVGWLADALMPFFHERFVLMGAAMLLVAVAIGLAALLARHRLPAAGALGVILALNLLSLSGWYTDPRFIKSDYGATLQALLARLGPRDVILLNNSEQQALFDFYVPDRAGRAIVTLSNDDVLTADSAARALGRATRDHERAWLVSFGDPAVYDPERDAERWLSDHGFRSLFESHLGFEIARYELADALPGEPTQTAAVTFGEGIHLTGLDIRPQPAAPGGALLVTLFWRADSPISARYTVFTHLIDAQGWLAAQFDGEPAGGARPTPGWTPGATVIDRRAIPLPPDLTPGRYTLRVGLYTQPGLARLPIIASDGPVIENAAEVGAVAIAP